MPIELLSLELGRAHEALAGADRRMRSQAMEFRLGEDHSSIEARFDPS